MLLPYVCLYVASYVDFFVLFLVNTIEPDIIQWWIIQIKKYVVTGVCRTCFYL